MRAAAFLLTIPLLAQQQGVNFYTAEKEVALGRHLVAKLKEGLQPVSNPAVDTYVQRVARELTGLVKDPPFPFHFEVVTGGELREPAAVPGGFVLVPLVSLTAAQEESEFVGLLAHAIGHVALRHGTRQATRGEVVNKASIPLIFMGGVSGAHAESRATQVLIPLGALKFQRLGELEADDFTIDLMARGGFDSSAYRRYVERQQGADSERSALPPKQERLKRMQDLIDASPQVGRASSEEFKQAQEAAQSLNVPAVRKEPPTLRRP